ncbi:MAG TPA: CehA/McbA family metallohydrolase [Planctomycetota bacterium]|nr:CehA/McbA family metallohydrolase [Planctomycetota bacterium]HRR82519.1 CehA/McbA family metallohydrolase [Planctomycetota bacterium]HRT97448.1 CehA/McbA family metallohydrolase [Planctomycetota bacterium]
MHDYKGCLHIHSTYSDGHSPAPDILDAAREAGLDYIVLTDHDTLAARDAGLAGWRDGLLLDVGVELEAGGHHAIALGLSDLEGVRGAPTIEAAFQAVGRKGGLAFVVHPVPVHKPLFDACVPGWTDWHLDGYHGVEIWPYLHDWIRDLHLWNLLSHYRHPDRWIRGPEPSVLAHWDAAGQRRRVVGIGSLDNHAKRVPFRRLGLDFMEFFPHRRMFGTVRTHVLSPEPFAGHSEQDTELLHRLLAGGRCYVSYDLLADATGFCFEGRHGQGAIAMGEETQAAREVSFRVVSPVTADLRLLRDGRVVASARGRELKAAHGGPGVYRVEASLDGRPWVFTNPIYLRG